MTSKRGQKKAQKLIIEETGINNNRVCLYIEDHTIVEDEFLEVINSQLSSNEIVGLYKVEEVEGLLKDQSDELKRDFMYLVGKI